MSLSIDIPWDDVYLPYTVTGTYIENNGKFSQIYGNVAIVDCNYFYDDLLAGLKVAAQNIEKFVDREVALLLIAAVKAEIKNVNLTVCDTPYEVNGVLND